MGRPKTKDELIIEAEKSYKLLLDTISSMSEKQKNTFFDFSTLNKKEMHWTRDKDVKDLLTHIYEWQQLLLNWTSKNLKGESVPFLPEQYNWSNYYLMNMEFFKKHQNTTLEDAYTLLNDSHREIMDLIKKFSSEELFTKKYYKWVGTSCLGQYFISTTVAHYEWAINKIKMHKKLCI